MGSLLGLVSHTEDISYGDQDLYSFLGGHRWHLLGALLLGVLTYKVVKRRRNLPPGPTGLPLLGAIHTMNGNFWDVGMELRRKYGDVVSFYIGSE